jgi:hypothetical protein
MISARAGECAAPIFLMQYRDITAWLGAPDDERLIVTGYHESVDSYLAVEYEGCLFVLFDGSSHPEKGGGDFKSSNDYSYSAIASDQFSLSNGLRVGMSLSEAEALQFPVFTQSQSDDLPLWEPEEFGEYYGMPLSLWAAAADSSDGGDSSYSVSGIHGFNLLFDDGGILRVIIACR